MTRRLALRLLAQMALGLFVVLLGWGLDDWRGFFAHPARAALLTLAVAGAVAAILLRLDLQIFRRGQRPVGWQRLGVAGLMAFGLFMAAFFPYADRRGVLTFAGSDWLRWLGVLLYAGGTSVLILALKTLGRQYSAYVTLQDDHQLVTSGIYGIIRHPIYLRALLVAVGLPLVFRSWLVLAMVPLMAVFVSARVAQEEKLLGEQFGAEYEAYRRRTWRLVPYFF